MIAQLVATQQRVVKLTTLAKEAANLQSWVAEARWDDDEAKKAFEALLARSQKDDEEATRVRKEQDELLQKDAKTRPRILDLLADVEKGTKAGGRGEAHDPREEGEPRGCGGRSATQGAG